MCLFVRVLGEARDRSSHTQRSRANPALPDLIARELGPSGLRCVLREYDLSVKNRRLPIMRSVRAVQKSFFLMPPTLRHHSRSPIRTSLCLAVPATGPDAGPYLASVTIFSATARGQRTVTVG